MAKMLNFARILCVFLLLGIGRAWAGNAEMITPVTPSSCTLPPVQNLHVTARGYGYLSLAWTPTESGEEYTLTYFKKSENLEWVPVDTIYDVTDQAYTILGVDHSSDMLISLATNCSAQEPSSTPAVLELPKVILDLVVGGRIPINPQPIENCGAISIGQHWLGFKVINNDNNSSSLFEVESSPDKFVIRRLSEAALLVAARSIDLAYPASLGEKISTTFMFHSLADLQFSDPALSEIGKINYSQIFTKLGQLVGVGWCVDQGSNPTWKPNYTFIPLKAEATFILPPGFDEKNGGFSSEDSGDKITLNNPFSDKIIINNLHDEKKPSSCLIELFDIEGRKWIQREFESGVNLIEFETTNFRPGNYILRISRSNSTVTFKLQKNG